MSSVPWERAICWLARRFSLALPTVAAPAPALLAAGGALPASDALPRYIRDKVAQTTAERAALRAAQAVATPPSPA